MNIQTVSSPTRNKKARYYTSGVLNNSFVTVASSPFVKLEATANDTIEKVFQTLKNEWFHETVFSNSLSEINESEPLQTIIALGAPVVPLILAELQKEPNHWFFALRKLTGVDPIKAGEAGNIPKMRTAWLEWAKREGVEF